MRSYPENSRIQHCVKSVQIQSFFWSTLGPSTRKYGLEKTPCLDTLHSVQTPYLVPIKLLPTHFSKDFGKNSQSI